MPLTQQQLDAIEVLLHGYTDDGPDNLNTRLNDVVNAREDIEALVRIHENLPDAVASDVMLTIRQRAKAAAQSIVDLIP